MTKLPVSVRRLQADALAKGDHSLVLSGNIQLARGEIQVPGTDAHHIVSRTHRLAKFSRKYLFDWRIGIDDADNGVFLPRAPGANIAGLEKANAHDPIHSKLYHATVAARLLGRRTDGAAAGRAELQSMRADMIAGTPVQKGLNMSIWELRTQSPDKFAPLVPSDAQVNSGVFEFDGTPRQWKRRPVVEVYHECRKKDQLPRGDVSLLLAGSLVLNQKAVDALGAFLAQFGQLLEAKVDDKIEYFYNVTRVIDCIDPDRSERRSSGSIVKEAFRADALPVGPTVFKDPRTARIRIYVNDEARQVLEASIAANGLTGFELAQLGAG